MNSGEIIAEAQQLRPVMTWKSRVVQVKTIDKHTPVGYGSVWTSKRPSVIGLVPVGYADGYPAGVGVRDNITIGAGAQIGARSGVMDDIPAGEIWVGYPARPAKETMRIVAATGRLPKLMKQLRARGIEPEATDD